ncbi:Tripartite tricarboxylate transporter family receptor [compost metagenome]
MVAGVDVAWVAVGSEENDLSRLMDEVVAALGSIDPTIVAEARVLAGRGSREAVERVVISLVQGVTQSKCEIAIMHRRCAPSAQPRGAARGSIADRVRAAEPALRHRHAQHAAAAGTYPERPVKIIVSLPPGSGADTTARFLAQHLSQSLGQHLVVENKPGANSFIAAKAVAKAPADGYTLFVVGNSPMVTNIAEFRQLPYDSLKDFAPVAGVARFPMVIVVPANLPYKTLPELVAAMKAAPGKLSFASGTPACQVAMERFHERNGIKSTAVPYKGTGPAISDVAEGICDYSIAEVSSALPLVRRVNLRALAVASGTRHKDLPKVPTAAESGNKGHKSYLDRRVLPRQGVA